VIGFALEDVYIETQKKLQALLTTSKDLKEETEVCGWEGEGEVEGGGRRKKEKEKEKKRKRKRGRRRREKEKGEGRGRGGGEGEASKNFGQRTLI
jgi:hypothetical protein